MATKHQKRTAERTGKIPTGQSLKLTPKERLRKANITVSSRDTNSARIKYETDAGGASVYGGMIETSTAYLIFNVDGEIYLKADSSYQPCAYGRHEADAVCGHRGDKNPPPDLRTKADRLAKELQKIVDEAGRGDPPTKHDVRLRELEEDNKRFRYGKRLISAHSFEELNSPLGGLRAKAIRAARKVEELTEEIQRQIAKELEDERLNDEKAKGE